MLMPCTDRKADKPALSNGASVSVCNDNQAEATSPAGYSPDAFAGLPKAVNLSVREGSA